MATPMRSGVDITPVHTESTVLASTVFNRTLQLVIVKQVQCCCYGDTAAVLCTIHSGHMPVAGNVFRGWTPTA